MQFFKNGELPPQSHMYFVYGDGGTGKTSLFKLMPGEKKLLISFDLSTDVLKGTAGLDVAIVQQEDMPQIQSIVEKWLSGAIGAYDTIALDNMTSLQNMVLENIDGASKDGRQNYQKLQLWFRQMGTILRQSNVNVYATAHQVDKGPEFMEGRFSADMNEKTFNAFTSMFDLVGRIYIKDGKRLIDLDPERGNHAKNRLDDRKLINADELFDLVNQVKKEK
ncbi:phage nucleotide-binding protein [Lactobacillus phage phiPYB5]|uniref:Sak4-like ssDNA annealing protein n=1 Tax=Lactobacillus phage phiPYB5 TaxID=438780 RepID=UPI0001C0ADB3|nr:Sak4-like ssDNA annealing protein [Lactobacillus phage phiPYB5]ADA79918.1 phage nucleotide-binding protein [Lactobacillus phage phiPYB5]